MFDHSSADPLDLIDPPRRAAVDHSGPANARTCKKAIQKALKPKPSASGAKEQERQESSLALLDAKLQLCCAFIPGILADSHVSLVAKKLISAVSDIALTSGMVTKPVAFLTQKLGDTFDRKFLLRAKMNVASVLSDHEKKFLADLVAREHQPKDSNCKGYITALTWMWDETEQTASNVLSQLQTSLDPFLYSMLERSPLTKTYLEAKRRGASTSNVVMSTIVQQGELQVVDLMDSTWGQPLAKKVPILVPPCRLLRMTASTIKGVLDYWMPLTATKRTKLADSALYNLIIYVADGATANSLFKKHEVMESQPNTLVLDCTCQCHAIHLASGDQTFRLDLPPSWPPKPQETATAAPAPRGRGRGGKGRGRGRGVVPEQGQPQQDQSQSKKGKGKVVSMLSSLVRTGNQMGNSSSWTIVLGRLRPLIAEKLVLQRLSELADGAEAQMELNKGILIMLGKLNPERDGDGDTDSTARSEVSPALHESSTELLRIVGYSDWRSSNISIYLEDSVMNEITGEPIRCKKLHASLADHLTALVSHIFLGHKPARPSQSRWTGVAHVCQWALGLALFHRLLGPLLCSLSAKKTDDAGGDDSNLGMLMDADVQIADSEAYRIQTATRRQLLAKWAADPATPLKLFLVMRGNLPIRTLLFYVLKYEANAQEEGDLRELCRRYMFNLECLDLEPDEYNRAARGFPDWVAGGPTQRALQELAELLFESEFLAQLLSWFSTDVRRSDIMTFAARYILAGAANVWLRLHRPLLHPPFNILRLGASYSPGDRLAGYENLLLMDECCLDPGFGRRLQESLLSMQRDGQDELALMNTFERTCTVAGNCARIGNFKMECQHKWNQSLQGATRHLGAAKQWTKMAAEAFLISVQTQHQQLLAKPVPAKSRRGKNSRGGATERKDRRRVLKHCVDQGKWRCKLQVAESDDGLLATSRRRMGRLHSGHMLQSCLWKQFKDICTDRQELAKGMASPQFKEYVKNMKSQEANHCLARLLTKQAKAQNALVKAERKEHENHAKERQAETDAHLNMPKNIGLWGLQFTDPAYPVDAALVMDGKARGLTKTNAADVLQRNLPVYDHNPLLQRVMTQVSSKYLPACWVHGICRRNKAKRKLCDTLHRTLMKGIKEQIAGFVPEASAKDYLVSGDLVVAIRFPALMADSSSSSGSAGPTQSSPSMCEIFAVPKVTLRPEGAVFVAMDQEIDCSGPNPITRATLRRSDATATGLEFCTSSEFCARVLMQQSPGLGQPIWIKVLQYTRVSLHSIEFDPLPDTNIKDAVWPVVAQMEGEDANAEDEDADDPLSWVEPSEDITEEDQLLGLGELAESFEAVSDLVSELFLESAFEKGHDDPENESQSESKTKRPSTVQTEKIFTDVIKQPLPGEIKREGRFVYCGSVKCGSVSFLTHWSPPAIVAACNLHSDCCVSVPLLDGDEDSLVKWLGEAVCYKSGSDHSQCRPKGSYNKRLKM